MVYLLEMGGMDDGRISGRRLFMHSWREWKEGRGGSCFELGFLASAAFADVREGKSDCLALFMMISSRGTGHEDWIDLSPDWVTTLQDVRIQALSCRCTMSSSIEQARIDEKREHENEFILCSTSFNWMVVSVFRNSVVQTSNMGIVSPKELLLTKLPMRLSLLRLCKCPIQGTRDRTWKSRNTANAML